MQDVFYNTHFAVKVYACGGLKYLPVLPGSSAERGILQLLL
jgi:hypothetical protein